MGHDIYAQRAMEVKVKLLQNALTQNWLIHRLSKRGIFTGKGDISLALNATRMNETCKSLVDNCYEILVDYENKMNND